MVKRTAGRVVKFRLLSLFLAVAMAFASLAEVACYGENEGRAATTVADAGDAGKAQLPMPDDMCQHGHHHLTPMPVPLPKAFALNVSTSDGIPEAVQDVPSPRGISLDRPPRA